MSILLAPLLEQVGAGIITVVESTGASTSTAGMVAGAGVGFLSGKIDEAVEAGLEKAIGEENVKNIKTGFSEVIGGINAIENMDVDYFTSRLIKPSGSKVIKEGVSHFSAGHTTREHLNNIPEPIKEAGNLSVDDVSKFFIDMASEVAIQGLESEIISVDKAITEVVRKKPHTAQLASTLGSYLQSKIPNTDAYRKVANTYNGLNLNYEDVEEFVDLNDLISHRFKDELGYEYTLQQTVGFYIPSMYGVFVGAYSKNDSKPISLLDYFAMHHDYSYTKNGFFHELGDLQFISRIAQNFNRMTDEEKPYARFCILYFSTLGNLIASAFNSVPEQEIFDYVNTQVSLSRMPTEDEIIRVEDVVSPSKVIDTTEPIIRINKTMDVDFYDSIKPLLSDVEITPVEFDIQFKDKLVENYISPSVNAFSGSNTASLLYAFDNLMVSLD